MTATFRAGTYWADHGWSWDGWEWDWQDEGWSIDFFVSPREAFPELGQPVVDWCVARGIVLREPVPGWESRCELVADVTPEQALEFRLTWETPCVVF
jgi:hypothetical protein